MIHKNVIPFFGNAPQNNCGNYLHDSRKNHKCEKIMDIFKNMYIFNEIQFCYNLDIILA